MKLPKKFMRKGLTNDDLLIHNFQASKQASKGRFLFVLLAILLISGAAFYVISVPRHTETVHAVNGTVNLASADFNENIYALDGQWEFYDGRLYAPQDFASGRASGAALIDVPYSWFKEAHQESGYATYRLTILTKDDTPLMLHIPEITEAAIVYLNGEMIHRAGQLGATDEYIPAYRNAFVSFMPKDGRAEMIVQASNFYQYSGGSLFNSFKIGSEETLLREAMLQHVLLAAVLGLMAMMALYHLMLFAANRKEKVYLWFILYIAVTILRFALETNGLVQLLAPVGMSGFLSRMCWACLAGQMLFLTLFTFEAFGMPYLPRTTGWRITYGAGALILFSNVFGELLFPVYPEVLVYLSLLPFALMVVAAVYRFVKDRRAYAGSYMGLYVIAMCLFLFWGPGAKSLANNLWFVPAVFSNLFMVLSQAVILSRRYIETKRSEEALTERNAFLDKLNRSKTEFLQDMSHEMKAPLTVIATGVDYADRQMKKGSAMEAGDALDTVQEETQRLGRMVGGMVDLAAMDTVGENRRRVEFAALLKNSAEAFRIPIEQQGSVLAIELSPNLPDVFVERDRFVQVLANLLTNAADHTRSGRIDVSAKHDGAYVIVRVTDTGEGITPEILSAVFERGVSGRGGTGYGLYICKTAIEAHGGSIKIDSELGKGTVVTFTVPVYGGQEAGHNL